MKQAIVIATTPSSYVWLDNLLKTLEGYSEYPIVILSDYNYELGKLRWMMVHTEYEEFFLLQDSLEVLDTRIFHLAFHEHIGKSVAVDPTFKSYLGKYRREVLTRMYMPQPKSKAEAVALEEDFNFAYLRYDPTTIKLTNNFCRSEKYEEKFGRTNMVIECQWLKKYKGTWSREMVV